MLAILRNLTAGGGGVCIDYSLTEQVPQRPEYAWHLAFYVCLIALWVCREKGFYRL